MNASWGYIAFDWSEAEVHEAGGVRWTTASGVARALGFASLSEAIVLRNALAGRTRPRLQSRRKWGKTFVSVPDAEEWARIRNMQRGAR